MNWLDIGLKALPYIGKVIKGGRSGEGVKIDPKTGKPTGAGIGRNTGFMSAAADRFKLPGEALPSNVTLLTRGLGGSKQGLTDLERILEPIHQLQSNGYDALKNKYILAALQQNNTISSRDLLPETTSIPDSQNIKLGEVG